MASTGETAHTMRLAAAWTPATVLCAISGLLVVTRGGAIMGDDWRRAREAAGMLLSGDLEVYAKFPEAQMGPLAFLLAAPFDRHGYLVVGCLLLPIVLTLATWQLVPSRRLYAVTAAGGLLLAVPWSYYAATGHLDDALVAVGAVGMVAAMRANRDWWVCVAFLVAIAGKPTAALLLPLVLVASRRALLAACAGTALIWGPFFLADPAGFLSAGGGYAMVWPNSVPDLLGAAPGDPFPVWVRPVQFAGGMALCWVIATRRGPAAAVAAAFAFRAVLEPGGWAAYSTTVILAALAFDLVARRVVPWATLAAAGSYLVAFGIEPLTLIESAGRIVLLVLVIVLCAAQEGERSRATQVRPGRRGGKRTTDAGDLEARVHARH